MNFDPLWAVLFYTIGVVVGLYIGIRPRYTKEELDELVRKEWKRRDADKNESC